MTQDELLMQYEYCGDVRDVLKLDRSDMMTDMTMMMRVQIRSDRSIWMDQLN